MSPIPVSSFIDGIPVVSTPTPDSWMSRVRSTNPGIGLMLVIAGGILGGVVFWLSHHFLCIVCKALYIFILQHNPQQPQQPSQAQRTQRTHRTRQGRPHQIYRPHRSRQVQRLNEWRPSDVPRGQQVSITDRRFDPPVGYWIPMSDIRRFRRHIIADGADMAYEPRDINEQIEMVGLENYYRMVEARHEARFISWHDLR